MERLKREKPTTDSEDHGDADLRRWASSVIDHAVERAGHGDFKSLAALLHPDHPWNQMPDGRTIRAALPPDVWKLIFDRLSGRHKAKRGSPPRPEWEKRLFVPVYGAAIDFSFIKQFLRDAYREQKPKDIHDRALAIAAQRRGIKTDTLSDHLQRSKKPRLRRS
jgi:hypothetical protein